MAVISLDFCSVLICPMTSPPLSEHQAESIGNGDRAVARSKDDCTVLPSSETRAPWGSCATAWVQERKPACKRWGCRRAKTRPQVSCEGLPGGKARKVWRQ